MSETWTPPKGIDPDRPSPARVYDCYLGGTHNFAADRTVAAQAIAAMPQLPEIMRANRAFLRRAVRAVAAEGVDQFLDLGSGIPTEGTVHEVARQVRPGARVVYVDVDPVAVIHSRSILRGDPQNGIVQADLLDADEVLANPVVTGLLDLSRPVCLLLVAVLHFLHQGEQAAGTAEPGRADRAAGRLGARRAGPGPGPGLAAGPGRSAAGPGPADVRHDRRGGAQALTRVRRGAAWPGGARGGSARPAFGRDLPAAFLVPLLGRVHREVRLAQQ